MMTITKRLRTAAKGRYDGPASLMRDSADHLDTLEADVIQFRADQCQLEVDLDALKLITTARANMLEDKIRQLKEALASANALGARLAFRFAHEGHALGCASLDTSQGDYFNPCDCQTSDDADEAACRAQGWLKEK